MMLGIEASVRPRCHRAVAAASSSSWRSAQALVRDPHVLLLDEPTSALDLRRQLEVMQLIRKVTAERGLVTVAALLRRP